jgi:hypothetical protein
MLTGAKFLFFRFAESGWLRNVDWLEDRQDNESCGYI